MIDFIEQNNKPNVILFVHGFIGGKETWVRDDDRPKDFIQQLLKNSKVSENYDIAIFNYFTELSDIKEDIKWFTNFFGNKKKIRKNLSIDNLGKLLKSHTDVILENYEGIVLIGHSMGGLVCKKCILDTLEEDHKTKLKLYISLAVPHNGSNLADLGQIILNNPQIKDLTPLGDNINTLNSKWIKSNILPPTVYYQGHYDKIVPPTSSIGYDNRDVSVIYSANDHFSILHPNSENDVVIKSVLMQLKKVLVKNKIADSNLEIALNTKSYKDSRLGFFLELPEKLHLEKPQYTTYMGLLNKLGIGEGIKEKDLANSILLNHPFGNMIVNSENVLFQLGEDLEINFLDQSSLEEIEEYLDRLNDNLIANNESPLDDAIRNEIREKRFHGTLNIRKMKFPTMLGVTVCNKKFAYDSAQKANLPNVLRSFISTPEPIEDISFSGDNSAVTWHTRVKLLNIKVFDRVSDFTIYRIYKLIETENNFYMLQLNWSPDSKSMIAVYNQMETMLNSFGTETIKFNE
jgi:hypothetical protein